MGTRIKVPLLKGDLGGSNNILHPAQRCVYTAAYKERGFDSYSPSLVGYCWRIDRGQNQSSQNRKSGIL
ncbi:hypothetical protein EH233_11325 [Anabaena sp. YBS01]|nr:hypothetical protein EH233_11325 [Anabaena sp. YBS01]